MRTRMHYVTALSLLFIVGCYSGEGTTPEKLRERASQYREQIDSLAVSAIALDALAAHECDSGAPLSQAAIDACVLEGKAMLLVVDTLRAARKALDLYEAGLIVGEGVGAAIDPLRAAVAKVKPLVIEVQDAVAQMADDVRGLGGGPDGGVAKQPAAAPEAEPASDPQAPADPAPQPQAPAER